MGEAAGKDPAGCEAEEPRYYFSPPPLAASFIFF